MPIIAYIDPVTGAIVLQLIVAGAIGAVAYFRKGLWKLVRLFTGRKSSDSDE